MRVFYLFILILQFVLCLSGNKQVWISMSEHLSESQVKYGKRAEKLYNEIMKKEYRDIKDEEDTKNKFEEKNKVLYEEMWKDHEKKRLAQKNTKN